MWCWDICKCLCIKWIKDNKNVYFAKLENKLSFKTNFQKLNQHTGLKYTGVQSMTTTAKSGHDEYRHYWHYQRNFKSSLPLQPNRSLCVCPVGWSDCPYRQWTRRGLLTRYDGDMAWNPSRNTDPLGGESTSEFGAECWGVPEKNIVLPHYCSSMAFTW